MLSHQTRVELHSQLARNRGVYMSDPNIERSCLSLSSFHVRNLASKLQLMSKTNALLISNGSGRPNAVEFAIAEMCVTMYLRSGNLAFLETLGDFYRCIL